MTTRKHIRAGSFFFAFVLTAVFAASFCIPAAADELMGALTYRVTVDGREVYAEKTVQKTEENKYGKQQNRLEKETVELTLGGYTNGYDNMIYVSLRDLAALLNGTSRQFDFRLDYEKGGYCITSGAGYVIPEPETEAAEEPETREGEYFDKEGNLRNKQEEILWEPVGTILERPGLEYLALYQNTLFVDGKESRLYSYQLSSLQDLYINIIDVQLLLAITIREAGDHALQIFTDRGCEIDLAAFEDDGYFELFNGVLLGDADTGEILYGYKETNPDAIASTSKLMTFLVVARNLELQRIHLDDKVTISQKVENLAYSGNGSIYLNAGQEVTVRDLLAAMLLASSNESALALAEFVAGSEERFVEQMNKMAAILGLSSARFYNPHGLVQFSESLMASRIQNRMSAEDLFRLSCAVLRKYPTVTGYTSKKSMYLESLDTTVWNTNQLLYNMDQIVGLKTGTTDEAGCCLVAAGRAQGADGEHTLIAIVLGAVSNLDRYQVPSVLLTWGRNHLSAQAAAQPAADITISAKD